MLSVLLVVSLFCKDVWGSSVDGCRDLDTGRGVYDTDGRSCDFYDAKPDQCALFDDPDFHAGDVCCACNGGEKGTSSSTTIFRGTRPPRQTNANSTPNRRTTAPPRDEPRGGIDTTKATQQGDHGAWRFPFSCMFLVHCVRSNFCVAAMDYLVD